VCTVYDSFRVDKVAVSNALTGAKRHVVSLISAGLVSNSRPYTYLNVLLSAFEKTGVTSRPVKH